jgi:acetyl-CoA carboxylase carboxyl transferase subunit alpha
LHPDALFCAIPEKAISLCAAISDDGTVAKARIYFRKAGDDFYNYVDMVFDEFVELHGDRAFGDDRAIRTGFARLGEVLLAAWGMWRQRRTVRRIPIRCKTLAASVTSATLG